jgi:hypothetical protein
MWPSSTSTGSTFELERFKAERGWYNLNLTRQGNRAIARRSELVPAADSG